MKPKKKEFREPAVRKLNDELFSAVEKHQGFAHISDGMDAMDRDRFFEAVRFALDHSHVATEKLRDFLRKYGELKATRRRKVR
jgi:hypothetical protein